MKDLHKRNRLKVLPWMFNSKCRCCNWTLNGDKRKNRRLVKKSIRAKLKQDLQRGIE
jgi:hypothetical protein